MSEYPNSLSKSEIDFIERFIAALPDAIADKALRDALAYVVRAEVQEWAKAKEALSHTQS